GKDIYILKILKLVRPTFLPAHNRLSSLPRDPASIGLEQLYQEFLGRKYPGYSSSTKRYGRLGPLRDHRAPGAKIGKLFFQVGNFITGMMQAAPFFQQKSLNW